MEDETITRDVVVGNKLGLHLRPAAKIVKALAVLDCHVTLTKNHLKANAKSIMSVTTLIAPKGTVLTIEASGRDARSAVEALTTLFQENFGED